MSKTCSENAPDSWGIGSRKINARLDGRSSSMSSTGDATHQEHVTSGDVGRQKSW